MERAPRRKKKEKGNEVPQVGKRVIEEGLEGGYEDDRSWVKDGNGCNNVVLVLRDETTWITAGTDRLLLHLQRDSSSALTGTFLRPLC